MNTKALLLAIGAVTFGMLGNGCALLGLLGG